MKKPKKSLINIGGQEIEYRNAEVTGGAIEIRRKKTKDEVKLTLYDQYGAKNFRITNQKEELDYMENVFVSYEKYLIACQDVLRIEEKYQERIMYNMTKITQMLNSQNKPFSLWVKMKIMQKFKLPNYINICDEQKNSKEVFGILRDNLTNIIKLHKDSLEEKLFDDNRSRDFIELLDKIIVIFDELISIYQDRIKGMQRIINLLS